jgi:hypothetical protein
MKHTILHIHYEYIPHTYIEIIGVIIPKRESSDWHWKARVELCLAKLSCALKKDNLVRNPLKARRSVYEHLVLQRRSNPKGGLCCGWCCKRSGSPFARTFDTPNTTQNKASMRKLWPPKVGGKKGKNGKARNTWKLVQ